jgi:hypothetical protein
MGSGIIDSWYPYVIENSLLFRGQDDTAPVPAFPLLKRTWTGTGDRRTWTFSTWMKRMHGGGAANSRTFGAFVSNTNRQFIGFRSDETIQMFNDTSGVGGAVGKVAYHNTCRDYSNWYHLHFVFDSTEGTAVDRQKIWINGVLCTDQDVYTAVTLNFEGVLNTTGVGHQLLCENDDVSLEEQCFIAETHFMDGLALDVGTFGLFQSGIWVPKGYTGSHGDEGFYLKYDNSSDFGEDSSGNGNDFTGTNLVATDQTNDTPTNNWAVFDKLSRANANINVRNGGLQIGKTATWADKSTIGTTHPLPQGRGKWYAELKMPDISENGDWMFGIMKSDFPTTGFAHLFSAGTHGFGIFCDNTTGDWRDGSEAGGQPVYAPAGTPADNDIGMVAVDLEAGKMWLGVNDTWWYSGNPATGANPTFTDTDITDQRMMFAVSNQLYGGNRIYIQGNFGSHAFHYTPPSGFKAVNSKNILAQGEINEDLYLEGKKGFDVAHYDGNSAPGNAITDLEFSPDLVWIKARNRNQNHRLFDTVRGVDLSLKSNEDESEDNDPTSLVSFDANGFTVNQSSLTNLGSTAYTSYNWKINPNYGFDIQRWDGDGENDRAIPHNLGRVPELIIGKRYDDTGFDWFVYSPDLTNITYYVAFNDQSSQLFNSDVWGSPYPTTSDFYVSNDELSNSNNDDYIAYLFASIPGFSKYGTYGGNSLVEGPFLYTGFRPRWIMIRILSGTGPWMVFDTRESPYNPLVNVLFPNNWNDIDDFSFSSTGGLHVCSNGFKIISTVNEINDTGDTFIYMAFAEMPFTWANAF